MATSAHQLLAGFYELFFSHCTLSCIHCQNFPWSQNHSGTEYNVTELAEILRDLASSGCHNWNLVSPTPWLPMILEALDRAEHTGVDLPVVYNTSGFESEATLRALTGRVSVYLTDLRYADGESAAQGSD